MTAKTLFMTILDAEQDTLRNLREVFEQIPELKDNYDILLTNQFVQTMSPDQLIESLKDIHNLIEDGDPNNVGLTRTDRFRRGMHIMNKYIDETNKQFKFMKQQMDDMMTIFNRHVHPDTGLSTTGGPDISIPIYQFDDNKLGDLQKQFKDVAPREGEMI